MTVQVKFKELTAKIKLLLLENNDPKAIALGLAIGVFIGCSPFYGFHTVLAVLVAYVMHKPNRLAIIVGTQVSLPFIAPFIYWLEYKLGKALLFCDLVPQTRQDRLLEASNIEIGLLSILVGSIAVGLAFAWVTYIITLNTTVRIRARQANAPSP